MKISSENCEKNEKILLYICKIISKSLLDVDHIDIQLQAMNLSANLLSILSSTNGSFFLYPSGN